jgi:enoyl-CoA hydratase
VAKFLKTTGNVTFEVRDRVARITLNRPEKRNALSPALLAELNAALKEADNLSDVNCMLLSGAGKDFCAGYDLTSTYAAAGAADDGRYRTHNATLEDDIYSTEEALAGVAPIFDTHKPVIAKVQGNCLAGGTDLAFMCDLVIAADDARIGFPAARANGTPPGNQFIYHCGPQWAKRILFTGDSLWGRDAARIGLILDSYPAEELDAAADELARRVGSVDGEMLATHKRAVNLAMELMGAKTIQRLCAELDARAHLTRGAARVRFRKEIVEQGVKVAVTNRDAPFGDSMIKINWASRA